MLNSSIYFPNNAQSGNSGATMNSDRNTEDKGEKAVNCLSNNATCSPGRSTREKVLKEVGLTSAAFIGPALPSVTPAAKSDIEDTLSEFYKELEKIDTPDAPPEEPQKEDAEHIQTHMPPETFPGKELKDSNLEKNIEMSRMVDSDEYQENMRHKHPSWPHWYNNEPYYPRRPRPGIDPNHWQYSQRPTRPPDPRYIRPPQFPQSNPLPAFPYPHNIPPHFSQNWNTSAQTNHYKEDLKSENVSRLSSQDIYGKYSHYSDKDDRSYDALSDNVTVGWSRNEQPCPQNLPPHFSQNWSTSVQTEDLKSKNTSRLPPQNAPNNMHLPQDIYGEYSHYSDKDDRGYDALSDNANVGWSRRERNEQLHLDQDYDWRQECVSENELWERQHHSRPPDSASHSSCVLILMRGLPGSGKSTLARELLSSGPSGLILSTDDYFAQNDGYRYDPGLLGAAHEWNQRRAIDAMYDGCSPIIIDNTNIQAWEMKPYVKVALERGYRVDFCEPDTSWKFDPLELERRNKHGVPQEKIAQMLDRFSFPISVNIVMSSQEPRHVTQRHRAEPRATTEYQH